MVIDYDGQEYRLDIDEITVSQAMLLKVKTGFSLMQWQAKLEEADVDALKFLYWLMVDQSGKRVNFESIDFKIVKFAQAVQAAQDAEENSEANPTIPV
jgi:hypothetical protein